MLIELEQELLGMFAEAFCKSLKAALFEKWVNKQWVVTIFQAEQWSWAIQNKATEKMISLKSGNSHSLFSQILKSAAFSKKNQTHSLFYVLLNTFQLTNIDFLKIIK